MHFYTSIFKNSKIGRILRYGSEGPEATGMPAGSVLTVEFQLDGQEFVGLNGGPQFPFTEAVSFTVNCETQDEVDYYWEKLCEGGEESMCGWLKDKFGLSWQIVPNEMTAMLMDENREKASRAMQAMMKMRKIHLPTIKKAFEGVPA